MKRQKRIIIFLGPPGSGKGTLSQLCVKRLGWQKLSTGNLCRDHIARQSSIGKKIDLALKSGKLINDNLIIDMVDEWLGRTLKFDRTVILDGFPRTVAQAEALDGLISKQEVKLDLVHLALSDDEVIDRLLARLICCNGQCEQIYSLGAGSTNKPEKSMVCTLCESPLVKRSDDVESAIHERLRIYHSYEKELLSFYEDIGHTVNTLKVSMPVEKVYTCFLDATGFVGT